VALHQTYGAENWILVLGVSVDKKADEIAKILAPAFDMIVCTAAHHKGADAAALAASVSNANPKAAVQVATTIEQAFSTSKALASSLKRRIYVAGGLFTATEYAAIARGLDAKDLAFF